MVFSSILFLFGFLPLFLILYYVCPLRLRNLVALMGSLVFYAWGEPRFLFFLLASCWADFEVIKRLARTSSSDATRRRGLLAASILINVSALLYFKYANFLQTELSHAWTLLHLGSLPIHQILMPLGISFFTFHKLSYSVDVYRTQVRPTASFSNYLLYIMLFPQLVAGPIIRYHDVAEQIVQRSHALDKVFEGLWRFSLGLGKKVLIANALAPVADLAFAMKPCEHSLGTAWLGLLAYTFQIYFDFSGYSDMAIGLGLMMGFRFRENFNRPYVARNFTEFWQRWHISLSNWMKEYLYIPLGGNRGPAWKTYLNLWIVFLISGFWHGANWTFLAWGAYQGLFLTLDRLPQMSWLKRLPGSARNITTFLLIMLGWTLFRSESLGQAFQMAARLVDVQSLGSVTPSLDWIDVISCKVWWIMGLAALFSFIPGQPWMDRLLQKVSIPEIVTISLKTIVAGVMILLSICSLSNQTSNPFIYFRF